jgi:hypothetical protein
VNTLVTAYAKVPEDISKKYDQNFERYFNCEKNFLCLQGQASDTLFAVRTTSRDISTTTTGLNATLPIVEHDVTSLTNTFNRDVPKITGNVADITGSVRQLLVAHHWWDRFL